MADWREKLTSKVNNAARGLAQRGSWTQPSSLTQRGTWNPPGPPRQGGGGGSRPQSGVMSRVGDRVNSAARGLAQRGSWTQPSSLTQRGTWNQPRSRPPGLFGAVPPSVNDAQPQAPEPSLLDRARGLGQRATRAIGRIPIPGDAPSAGAAQGRTNNNPYGAAANLAGRAAAAVGATGAAVAGLAGGPAAVAQSRAPVAQQPMRQGGAYPGTKPRTGTAVPAGGPVPGPAPGTDNPAARPAPAAGVSPGVSVSNNGTTPAGAGTTTAAAPGTTQPDDNPAPLPDYAGLSDRLGTDFAKGFTADASATDYSLAGLNIGAAQHQLRGRGAAADWQNDVINNAAAAGQVGKTLRVKGPDGKDFTFRLDGKPEQWAGINSEEARTGRMLSQFGRSAQNDWRADAAANTEANAPVTGASPMPQGTPSAPPAAVAGDQHGELLEQRRQMAFLNAPDSQSGRQAVSRMLADQAGLSAGENLNAYSIGQLEQKARDANLSNRGNVTAEEFNTPNQADFTQAATMQPLAAKASDWFQEYSRGLGQAAVASGEVFKPASSMPQLMTVAYTKFDGVNPEVAQAAFAAEGLAMPLGEGTAAMAAAGVAGDVLGGRNGRGTGRREAPLGFFDDDALPPLNPNLVSGPTVAGAPGANPYAQTFDPAAAGFNINFDRRRLGMRS